MKRKFEFQYKSADIGDYRVIFQQIDSYPTDLLRIIKIKYAKRLPWPDHMQGTEASRIEDDDTGLEWIRPGKDVVRIDYEELAHLMCMLNVAARCYTSYIGDVDVVEVTKKK